MQFIVGFHLESSSSRLSRLLAAYCNFLANCPQCYLTELLIKLILIELFRIEFLLSEVLFADLLPAEVLFRVELYIVLFRCNMFPIELFLT